MAEAELEATNEPTGGGTVKKTGELSAMTSVNELITEFERRSWALTGGVTGDMGGRELI